jgi:hypothetical protein
MGRGSLKNYFPASLYIYNTAPDRRLQSRNRFKARNFLEMTQPLFKNIIPPAVAGYAGCREDIEQYLRERYGSGINFNVLVSCPTNSMICFLHA